MRSRKSDSVLKSGVEYFSRKIEAALNARLKQKPAISISILSNYLASELFALLQWWLDQKMPYPPERMDEIFHDLINPTFRSALEIQNRER